MPIIIKKPNASSKTLASAAAAAAEPASPGNGELSGARKDERSRPPVNRRIPPNRPGGDSVRRRAVLKDKPKKTKGSSSSSSSSASSSSSSSASSSSSSGSSSSDNSSSDDDDDDDDSDEKKKAGRGKTEKDKSPPGGGGRTKDLAGFFAKQTDDSKVVRRKRFQLDEAPGTLVLENEPQRLEGVVRADDPGEWDKPIEIEKGRAKLLASMIQSRKPEDETKVPKRRFRLDVERGDPVVLENEPVVLEGVARSGEPDRADEEIFQERGRIKNIAERWKLQQEQHQHDHDDSDEDVPEKPKKPAWLVELESAKESGVYETESTPIVRDDVVRAEDDEPDVISVQRTRNLRKMWTQIEQEKIQQDKENDDKQPKKKAAAEVETHKESSTETDSDEEEDTSSEEEEEEKPVQRHFPVKPPGGQSRKEDLTGRGRLPRKEDPRRRKAASSSSASSSSSSRSSSTEGASNSKARFGQTLYVNEASLRYVPKK